MHTLLRQSSFRGLSCANEVACFGSRFVACQRHAFLYPRLFSPAYSLFGFDFLFSQVVGGEARGTGRHMHALSAVLAPFPAYVPRSTSTRGAQTSFFESPPLFRLLACPTACFRLSRHHRPDAVPTPLPLDYHTNSSSHLRVRVSQVPINPQVPLPHARPPHRRQVARLDILIRVHATGVCAAGGARWGQRLRRCRYGGRFVGRVFAPRLMPSAAREKEMAMSSYVCYCSDLIIWLKVFVDDNYLATFTSCFAPGFSTDKTDT